MTVWQSPPWPANAAPIGGFGGPQGGLASSPAMSVEPRGAGPASPERTGPMPGRDGPAGPAAAAGRPAGGGGVLSRRPLRWLLFGLMLGLFLSATEQSVVATALPTVAGDLGGASKLSWVVSAYLLTSTIVTPLYGKLSDLYGRRVVYQASISLFMVGSLLCGLAASMNQLVAARAVQGLGGGGLLSLAFVILGDVISPRERGRYMGYFTGTFAFASVSGPLYGGLLVDSVGWRSIFLLAVPLGLGALAVSVVSMRLPFRRTRRPIDWTGAVLLVVGSAALLLVAIWGGETFPWVSPEIGLTALVGIVFTVAFVFQERRAVEPILPLRLFRDRTVSAVYVMNFVQMFGLITVTTFLPLLLQVSGGASPTRSGLQVVPQSLAITITSTITGRVVSHIGRYKPFMVVGPVVAAIGMFGLSSIDADTTPLALAPYLIVLGVGLGLVFPNMTLAVQNTVAPVDLGVGTSIGNFFRSLGSTFGAAVMGSTLGHHLDADLAGRLPAGRLEQLGGAEGLVRSPADVRRLPPDVHRAVAEAVAGSVTTVIRLAAPLMLVSLAMALLIREKPLRTTSGLAHAADE